MTRLVSIALRVSAMGMQFVCGLLVTARSDTSTTASFFVAVAFIPLLVLGLGLELHTVTDRLVARGLSPVRAFRWLVIREALWVLVAIAAFALAWRFTGMGASFAVLLFANGIVGLLTQELFRLMIVSGQQAHAAVLQFVRNSIPFGIGAVAAVLGGFSVLTFLLYWLAAGLLAVGLGLAALSRMPLVDERALDLPTWKGAFKSIGYYLPSTLAARSMLSLDVVAMGIIGGSQVVVYGNMNAIILGFFALSEVSMVHWRMGEVIKDGGGEPLGRLRHEVLWMAAACGLAVLVFGVFAVEVGWAPATWPTLLVTFGLAATGVLIVMSQVAHLAAYAADADSNVRAAHLSAGVCFAAIIGLGIVTDAPMLVLVAKLLGWTVLFSMLSRQGTRVRTEVS